MCTAYMYYVYSGGKIFDPLLILYVCPLTKINYQFIILMVCLFEQSEADYQLKKRISKKVIN